MVTYQYRCGRHGLLEVRLPMGQAAEMLPCPVCADAVVRVFSAPMLSVAPKAVLAAIDRTERTREEPEVVSSLPRRDPSSRTPIAPSNPALRRLPRP